jgi:predicted metalloprotease
VQNITGIERDVRELQRENPEHENALSVRLELQADCYAGVWAQRSGLLEAGDIEEGMRAAEAIGDDTLQKQTQGRIVPESFTHGSSAQRMEALRRGLSTGNPASCNYA